MVLLQIERSKQNDDDDNDMQTTEEMPRTSMYLLPWGTRRSGWTTDAPGHSPRERGEKKKNSKQVFLVLSNLLCSTNSCGGVPPKAVGF